MNYTFNEGDNITVTAEFIDYLENLKKENQQLKEKYNVRSKAYNNILLENASLHNILDEIREYITNNTHFMTEDGICYMCDSDKILQILEKVKNNDS